MKRTKFPLQRTRFPKQYVKPPRWRPEYVDQIERMASRGNTRRDIAYCLGFHLGTLDYWLRTKPAVREAFNRGKKERCEEVEKALFQSAVGYSHEDTQFFMYKGAVIKQTYIKHYPPNAFAAYKWLTIQDRARWADVQKSDLTIRTIHTMDLSDFTDTELLALEKIGLKRLAENATTGNDN